MVQGMRFLDSVSLHPGYSSTTRRASVNLSAAMIPHLGSCMYKEKVFSY